MRSVYLVLGVVGIIVGLFFGGLGGGGVHLAIGGLCIVLGIVVLSLVGLVDRIEALAARLNRLEPHEPAPVLVASKVADAANAESEELKALFASAEQHHFAKRFEDAKQVYGEIVTRFPDSKRAAVARQQLENLKSAR